MPREERKMELCARTCENDLLGRITLNRLLKRSQGGNSDGGSTITSGGTIEKLELQ